MFSEIIINGRFYRSSYFIEALMFSLRTLTGLNLVGNAHGIDRSTPVLSRTERSVVARLPHRSLHEPAALAALPHLSLTESSYSLFEQMLWK